MTTHQPGILTTTDGRTGRSYAVLELLTDGRYCTCLRHHDIGGSTRVAYHSSYAEARRRYESLEVAAVHS